MEQLELRPPSQRQALEDEIMAAGGWHAVAQALNPIKYKESPDNAERHLRNAVNPEHIQKLDYYDALTIKEMARKRKGFSALVNFDCDHLNMTRPVAIEPEDEKDRIIRDLTDALRAVVPSVERLEKLGIKL